MTARENELADWLEAYAVQQDETCEIISGSDDVPPNLRLAASTLRANAARIKALEEALEPFAKLADVRLCGEWRDDQHIQRTDLPFSITFGDLRRARAARSNPHV